MMAKSARHGFTLLEVMVAVVILAIGLSALFTSEAGAMRIAHHARTTSVAALLARCKMGEIEEKIAKEGWPDSLDERDECCEDAEQEGFSCEWRVERVVLPEADLSEESALDQIAGNATGGQAGGDKAGLDKAATAEKLSESAEKAAEGTGADSQDPSSIINDMITSGGSAADPMADMVMSLAFPIMKPVMEEQVRRATVIVHWNEGAKEQSLDIVQFIVNELPMVMPEADEDADQPGQNVSTSSSSSSSTSSSSSGGR